MTGQTSESPFQLVEIGADGTLENPSIRLEPDDQQACQAMAALYRKAGFQPPWVGYVAVDRGCAVGGGAFVGPPADNRVEIAYYTSPGRQGEGYATLTAGRLVAIARAAAPDVQVFAKTEPRQNASTKILAGLGFARNGSTMDDEIGKAWLWLLNP